MTPLSSTESALAARRPARLLLLVLDPEHDIIPLLTLGNALVARQDGLCLLTEVLTVPPDESLAEQAGAVRARREALSAELAQQPQGHSRVKTAVRVARDLWQGVWETVAQEAIDQVLLVWHKHPKQLQELFHGALAMPPCDVIAVRPGEQRTDQNAWYDLQRILLPIRASPHAVLAQRIAAFLAAAHHGHITHLHVREVGEDEGILKQFHDSLQQLPSVTRSITAVGEVVETIVGESKQHDAVVLGAPTRTLETERWTGTMLDAVGMATRRTLVVVKQRVDAAPIDEQQENIIPALLDQMRAEEAAAAARPRRPTVARVVNKWFAENTFHSAEFADLDRMLRLKEAQGVTISLALPALNEEKTVGNVIRTVKGALMDDVPLLDEVVLIDSNSVDYTREIAQDLGVPVHIHQEILKERCGERRGKGEALWKSLHVVSGDIIVWIDTDIKNIHPRFVYGVLGPLLKERRVQYAKGFYRRPLQQGDKLVEAGGGRVTELTARPLLNLLFPELSGLIQPLSGEYAGRREALEQVPFFIGYGVETGLLIDLFERYDLNAIAQSDLLERVHHNQPLPSLSKMSFTIMQVVLSRLEARHGIRMDDKFIPTMNTIGYQPGGYHLEALELVEEERPPM
ncbi:MAG: glucosyl-3-phosphoglycerate synthase, partial [Acidobacteriota bacterium]